MRGQRLLAGSRSITGDIGPHVACVRVIRQSSDISGIVAAAEVTRRFVESNTFKFTHFLCGRDHIYRCVCRHKRGLGWLKYARRRTCGRKIFIAVGINVTDTKRDVRLAFVLNRVLPFRHHRKAISQLPTLDRVAAETAVLRDGRLTLEIANSGVVELADGIEVFMPLTRHLAKLVQIIDDATVDHQRRTNCSVRRRG